MKVRPFLRSRVGRGPGGKQKTRDCCVANTYICVACGPNADFVARGWGGRGGRGDEGAADIDSVCPRASGGRPCLAMNESESPEDEHLSDVCSADSS